MGGKDDLFLFKLSTNFCLSLSTMSLSYSSFHVSCISFLVSVLKLNNVVKVGWNYFDPVN